MKLHSTYKLFKTPLLLRKHFGVCSVGLRVSPRARPCRACDYGCWDREIRVLAPVCVHCSSKVPVCLSYMWANNEEVFQCINCTVGIDCNVFDHL